MKTLSIEELRDWKESPLNKLLDVRPIAAYNGWALNDEPRGGHIPQAKTFPLSWTEFDNWPELLEEKDITPENGVTLYAYDLRDAEKVARLLIDRGFKEVNIFEDFMNWSENNDLPLDHLPRYQKLVHPRWLKDLIDGKKPEHYDNDKFVICHASYAYREDYESGHIPGAIYLNTVMLEAERDWNRRTPEHLREGLESLGIDSDTTVILYGRFAHPNNRDEYPGRQAGHLAALRCAAIMLYAGVKDVRILNGGMASWIREGYDVTEDEYDIEPVDDFGSEVPAHPEYMVDMPEAKELLASDNGELVSIRSWEEFIGNVSGYNYIEKPGRIPDAIFGNCGSDAYHMENYRNVDHTMREYHEVADIWARVGIVPEKHIAFYCGTGWRASEAFFNAYFMGWPRISVYDGGWMEWCSDESNPVEVGEPEEEMNLIH